MNNLFNDVPLGTYNPEISARRNVTQTTPEPQSVPETAIAARDEQTDTADDAQPETQGGGA